MSNVYNLTNYSAVQLGQCLLCVIWKEITVVLNTLQESLDLLLIFGHAYEITHQLYPALCKVIHNFDIVNIILECSEILKLVPHVNRKLHPLL